MKDHLELSYWINPEVLNQLKFLSSSYQNNSPYPHISIPNFLIEDKAEEIKEALFELEFQEFDTDLYHFFKTIDIKNTENLPKIITEFHEFIFSTKANKFFAKLTSTPLSSKVGDLHSILCQQTHYLLCHDDQVDERIIAFIVNLSDDFEKEDGGALQLYDIDENRQPKQVCKTIIPKFNQLNVFTVSDISYHEISEIEHKDKNRISISGWYYKQ